MSRRKIFNHEFIQCLTNSFCVLSKVYFILFPGSDSNSSTSRKSDSASSSPAARKIVNPFDPEATVPLPFQLDDQFGPYSTSVWKRNERERCRVRCVNEGYDKLRNHLPLANKLVERQNL